MILQTRAGELFAGDKKVLKGWESFSGWYWFGVEVAEERKISEGSGSVLQDGSVMDDRIWFGFIQGFEEEWGYFSEAELLSMRGRVWPIKPQDLPHAGRRS